MKRIDDAVSAELGRFGPGGAMPKIVEVWVDAVGPTIARNAWPARISRDGTLHVAASSSAWAFELGQLRDDVLRRLKAAAGAAAPSSVRFAVGPLPELGPADVERRPPVPEPTTEQQQRAAALAAPIEDEELRNLVAKAAARSLSSGGSDRSF